jgi:hypothetical protein
VGGGSRAAHANQIEYLKTVNRALLERLRKRRLRFTDAERRSALSASRLSHHFPTTST